MAAGTRLYMRLGLPCPSLGHPPTAGSPDWNNTNLEKVGATDGRALAFSAGTAQQSIRINGTTTSVGDCAGQQFISGPLAAGPIAAGNWVAGFGMRDAQRANSYGKFYLGLFNGATGTQRTQIVNLASPGGNTRAQNTELTVYAVIGGGAAATITQGDYLVCEIGNYAGLSTQTYDFTLYADGPTAISADEAVTYDAGAFLQAPDNVTFSLQAVAGSLAGIAGGYATLSGYLAIPGALAAIAGGRSQLTAFIGILGQIAAIGGSNSSLSGITSAKQIMMRSKACRSSYLMPVNDPGTGPEDLPVATLQINRSWLPYLTGVLTQLLQTEAWDALSTAQQQDLIGRVNDLIDLIGCAS